MEQTPQRRPLLDAAELANYLLLTEETVRRLARQGDLPCIKAGRRVRFNLTDVLAYLENRK